MKVSTKFLAFFLALVMTISAVAVSTVVTAEETVLYKDVKPTRWSYNSIKYVSENGLMNGTGDGKFSPKEVMTRAMVVTVLYRLEGSPEVEYSKVFTDVPKNKWYTDAVIWASENGIVNGMGNGKYEPMTSIVREQLAAIIMRYADSRYILTDERCDIKGYEDYSRIRKYAREALSWANAVKLIEGVNDKILDPRGGATREQFAKILESFVKADFEYKIVYNTPVYAVSQRIFIN